MQNLLIAHTRFLTSILPDEGQLCSEQITAQFVIGIKQASGNGLKIKKIVNNMMTIYTFNGKNIVHMTQGSNDLHFFCDAQGKPAMVRFGDAETFCIYNPQGSVVPIIDVITTLVA